MAELKVNQTDAQANIVLGDKLVASNVPGLKDEMKKLIADGVTTMQLDCTQLVTLDSTGIGCLVAAYNTLSRVKGTLSLVKVSDDIYQLLRSLRLDSRLNITSKSVG